VLTLYFAYGSNLSIEQMLHRCPGADVVGVAVLPGHRLAFGGWSWRWGGPVATVLPAPGREVPGVLYRLGAADLAALDRFEGCPIAYQRALRPVVGQDGQKHRALVYALVDQSPAFTGPAAAYVDVLDAAYQAWGFDRRGLRAAIVRGQAGRRGRRRARGRARTRPVVERTCRASTNGSVVVWLRGWTSTSTSAPRLAS
jgi:gamma-glutamylcyclotransferase (GGCT)/AIG2-like uncharacterized protein YtfP